MAGRNGEWLSVVRLVGGLLGLAGLLTLIGVALLHHDWGTAEKTETMVSLVLTATSLAVGPVERWRRSPAPAVAGTPEVQRAKDVLAGLVAEQWRAEAAIRALDDPDPIPVRWRTPDQPPIAVTALMDHRANIEPGAGAEVGAWWTASSADIAALADRFRRTRRRLVILGGAGMGKTTLAMQLLLHLLDTRTRDEPIPVLLPVAGWDTERFRLHDWLANQLTRTYPALRSPELGAGVVRALTRRGHILPVLDGLDELPPPARAKMITALNASLGDGQLILTSRTSEFSAAVTQANDVVTSAAVLEPLPLSPAAAADYLTRWLPPSPGLGWQQILADLRAIPPADRTPPGTALSMPGAVLAEVAATPLGLWLLRSVYATPGTDPTELTNPTRFPTPVVMRAHLLDQIIPALITARPLSEDPAEPFRPRRHHDPAQVRRWLSYLAHHLTHQPITTGSDSDRGTRDFAWWRLAATTHAITRTTQLTLALLTALVAGLMAGLGVGLVAGLGAGLGVGLGGGLVAGVRVGLAARSWARDTPGYADLRIRRRSAELVRKLGFGLVFGLMGRFLAGLTTGLAAGFAFGLTLGLSAGLMGGFGVGLGVGFARGLTDGFVDWAEMPALIRHATTPMGNWRADRTLNLVRISTNALAPALGVALGTGLIARLVGGLTVAIGVGLVFGLVGGLAGGLAFGNHRAWPAYLVTTWRLARAGHLSRQLMPFLDDMHRLGLLRAVGPLYQFRHAELQDRLAATYRSHRHSRDQRNAVTTGTNERTGR